MEEAWKRSLRRLRKVDEKHVHEKAERDRQRREEAIPEPLREDTKKRAKNANFELACLQACYLEAGYYKHADDVGMWRASRLWDVIESGVPDEWLFEEDG